MVSENRAGSRGNNGREIGRARRWRGRGGGARAIGEMERRVHVQSNGGDGSQKVDGGDIER